MLTIHRRMPHESGKRSTRCVTFSTVRHRAREWSGNERGFRSAKERSFAERKTTITPDAAPVLWPARLKHLFRRGDDRAAGGFVTRTGFEGELLHDPQILVGDDRDRRPGWKGQR